MTGLFVLALEKEAIDMWVLFKEENKCKTHSDVAMLLLNTWYKQYDVDPISSVSYLTRKEHIFRSSRRCKVCIYPTEQNNISVYNSLQGISNHTLDIRVLLELDIDYNLYKPSSSSSEKPQCRVMVDEGSLYSYTDKSTYITGDQNSYTSITYSSFSGNTDGGAIYQNNDVRNSKINQDATPPQFSTISQNVFNSQFQYQNHKEPKGTDKESHINNQESKPEDSNTLRAIASTPDSYEETKKNSECLPSQYSKLTSIKSKNFRQQSSDLPKLSQRKSKRLASFKTITSGASDITKTTSISENTKFQNERVSDNSKHLFDPDKVSKSAKSTSIFRRKKNRFRCTKCYNTFIRQSTLDYHMKTKHDKMYHCTGGSCKKVFENIQALKSHIRTHSANKQFKCEVCDHAYSEKNLLRRHKEQNPGQHYICTVTSYCRRVFSTLAELQKHFAFHNGEKCYNCEMCEEKFVSEKRLQYHIRVKHLKISNKIYQCQICDKVYAGPTSLKNHKRTHSGEKPYICQYCGKTFISSGNLSTHTRFHTGIKPHICDYCGKGFTLKAGLRLHVRVHTGEKPYQCDFCERTFAISGNKRSHMNNIHFKHKQSNTYGQQIIQSTSSQEVTDCLVLPSL